MKLVVIIGPQAVGKMTVGHALEKITGLKLFHNHVTEHRLNHKPTKRNDWAEAEIKESTAKHRLNSLPGEITEKNYLRINNTSLSPEIVAEKIKEEFRL